MIGPLKYVTAGLGGLSLILAITCGILWTQLSAKKETIIGLRAQLKTETAEVLRCGETLQGLRDEVDEKNATIDLWKTKAATAVGTQAESDRLARERALAKRERAEIRAEREAFAERLSVLPRCDKYLATLVELSGGLQ